MFDKSKSVKKHGVSYFIVFIQWWSMCLYLISTSNNNDDNQCLISISSNDNDQCVYISFPYPAMMMINLSTSHIYVKQCCWLMCLYLISLSSNDDDDQFVYIFYDIKQRWLLLCLYLINISCNDDWLQCISISSNDDEQSLFISDLYLAIMMINVSVSHFHK